MERLETNPTECEPCLFGVLLGTLREMCRLSTDQNKRPKCEEDFEATLMGDISIPEYISRCKEMAKESEDALFTIGEVEEIFSQTNPEKKGGR